MADDARQPEVAGKPHPRLSQGRCGVDHSHQSAFHVLGASSYNPVAIADRRVALADGDCISVAVEQERTPAIAGTGYTRVHVGPSGLNLVESRIESLASEEIGEEYASRTFLAGFAFHLYEGECVPGDRFRIDMIENAMVVHCRNLELMIPARAHVRVIAAGGDGGADSSSACAYGF